jgi:hypothetical protein
LQAAQKVLGGKARENRSFDIAQDGLGGGVLLYVDAKSIERNEAYESFSGAFFSAESA